MVIAVKRYLDLLRIIDDNIHKAFRRIENLSFHAKIHVSTGTITICYGAEEW
jgi:hypothetical protein